MKTADIPIIFVTRSEDIRAAERLAEKTPKSVWFPRPTTEADVEHLLLLAGRLQNFTPVTDVQRLDETRKCLTWAGKIVSLSRGGWTQKIAGSHTVSYAPETIKTTKAAEKVTPKILEAPEILEAPALVKDPPATALPEKPRASSDPTLTALAEKYQPKKNAAASDPTVSAFSQIMTTAKKPAPAAPQVTAAPEKTPAPAAPAPVKVAPAPAKEELVFLEIYDISKLQTPVLNLMAISAYTTESADVLAWFGTPISQTTLMNFASSGTQDMDLRKKCVRSLKVSVDHFGILMNGTEVARQYDIYNETSADDDDSLLIRDAILTVLER